MGDLAYIRQMERMIQNHLTSDLLKPEYQYDANNPLKGHCYVASETLYYLLDGEKIGLKVFYGKDENNIVHWWLKFDNFILDPTADQYFIEGKIPPYQNGVCGGFLTKEPSKRTQILLGRIIGK